MGGLLTGGHRNRGHSITLPARTVTGSTEAELKQFLSYSVNQATAGQPQTQIAADDSRRVQPAEPGTDTIDIVMRWFPEASSDQRYLIEQDNVSLRFKKAQRAIASPAATARVAIATDGACTFTASGHVSLDSIAEGYCFRVGGVDYEIRYIEPASSPNQNNLAMATVYVSGTLASAVGAAAYTVVRGEAQTGSVSGSIVAPAMAGVGADSTGYQEETITFTPSGGLPTLTLVDGPTYS